MTEQELLLLWGKTCRDQDDSEAELKYHPLLFHLLDVGNCAALLWDKCLSQSTRDHLRKALMLGDADTARRAVVLLAALHDVGKAAPGFQLQVSAPLFLRPRLEAVRLKVSADTQNRPHSLITAFDLMEWLPSGKWVWTTPAMSAKILAQVVGAHHGTFPTPDFHCEFGSGVLGDKPWREVRRQLATAVVDLLAPGDPFLSGTIEDAGIVAILAGLIAVADWLGSSVFFPSAAHRDRQMLSASKYQQKSMKQAQTAMQRFGWLPGVQFCREPLEFGQFFGFEPNGLQRAVLRESATLNGPFLCIAEAPMGVGKTEAAFAGIDAALWQGQATGFYIALPTQATGNALHDRVRDDFLAKGRHRGNLNLQLVHSGALLKEGLKIQSGAIWDENSDKPTVAAQSWFTQRKQSLLAPFGVGTIDQSLTGVLQAKHWFVRLFGLAGKVVVFDEVHAYDTYMNTLLMRLLTWLRALNCSVILLSATLPSSRRRELLAAWGEEIPEKEEQYPRLTWVDGAGPRSLPISLGGPPKTINLRRLSTDTASLAEELREKLANGGCACVICNTVERAQNTYEALQNSLGQDFGEWHLFHARFPFQWRQEREAAILTSFGKKKAGRPPRAVVVATQVIEQSLDLDFDWMATELAPIDLVLQRAGRLHRHKRDELKRAISRPAGLETPELTLLCDEDHGLPSLDIPDEIYSHFILLRTYEELHSRENLELPRDIEPLIEAVYEAKSETQDSRWREMLSKAKAVLETRQKDARSKARGFSVSPPDDAETVSDAPSRELLDDDDPATHENLRATTRDGDPSIQCICLIHTEAGVFLPDSNGEADVSQLIDLDEAAGHDKTKLLLKYGVPISNRGLFYSLLKEPVPPGWKESAHLRFARALIFENGDCMVGTKTLRLRADLGLRIVREGEAVQRQLPNPALTGNK